MTMLDFCNRLIRAVTNDIGRVSPKSLLFYLRPCTTPPVWQATAAEALAGAVEEALVSPCAQPRTPPLKFHLMSMYVMDGRTDGRPDG